MGSFDKLENSDKTNFFIKQIITQKFKHKHALISRRRSFFDSFRYRTQHFSMVVKSKTRRYYRSINRFIKICVLIFLSAVLLLRNDPHVRHKLHMLAIKATTVSNSLQQNDEPSFDEQAKASCPDVPQPDWTKEITPKYPQPADRFLLPILSWGPNNQITGLAESMMLARHLNRTLVVPPFYRHHFAAERLSGGDDMIVDAQS